MLASLFFGACLVLAVHPAGAQTESRVRVGTLHMDEFPRITTMIDVRDSQGFFVSGLQPESVVLVEDGVEIPAAELSETRPGGQLVFAISPGVSFSIRDSQGLTRFDYIKSALNDWALASEAIDDLSLVTEAGTPASHRSDPTQFAEALANYNPELESATATLEPLATALDVALDSTPREGMGRAVVFITPALGAEFTDGLQSLADRAAAGNVRVYVWLVDSAQFFSNEAINPLRNLASQTGGQLSTFSGSEPLADIDILLESVRRSYFLAYRSRINQAGMHSLAVRVLDERVGSVSIPMEFDLQLQAPNPILVSTPAQVVRAIPDDAQVAPENFSPNTQTFEIVIEFPDTIERELTRTTLFLNGEIVAQNANPPFEQFSLDISNYFESERVTLVVEAEDELGMVGRSLETPLQITVQIPDRNFVTLISRNLPLFAAGVALVAGVALFLVLVLAGRLRPQTLSERTLTRGDRNDPVTQPLMAVEKQWIESMAKKKAKEKEQEKSAVADAKPQEQEAGRLAWLAKRFGGARLPWQPAETLMIPTAYLVPISEDGDPVSGEVLSLSNIVVVFGSAEGVSGVLIDAPEVEDRHARMWQDDDGGFHIADEDTTAGTWVNYQPVSREGRQLHHGDIVHIGLSGYRFTLSDPVNPRQPVVKAVSGNGTELKR
jgi:hypothetical protein